MKLVKPQKGSTTETAGKVHLRSFESQDGVSSSLFVLFVRFCRLGDLASTFLPIAGVATRDTPTTASQIGIGSLTWICLVASAPNPGKERKEPHKRPCKAQNKLQSLRSIVLPS